MSDYLHIANQTMKNTSNQANNKQPLGTTAYEKIYRKIVTLEYKPGQSLEEKQLVEQLGIGRTPIREALLRLSTDMIVESHHNKGFIVRPITLQNTRAVFEALNILELGVASIVVRQDLTPFLDLMAESNKAVESAVEKKDVLALVEANHEFHKYFARCSYNEYLMRGLHEVRCEADRLAYLSYGIEIDPVISLRDHHISVIRQHNDIINCLKERDEVSLKNTISEHIQTFQKRVIRYITS